MFIGPPIGTGNIVMTNFTSLVATIILSFIYYQRHHIAV